MNFILGFGWLLFFALYLIGLANYIALDVAMWRKQGIAFSWAMLRGKFAWPMAMLSDALKAVKR
jgi:hypothetical protein